MELRNGRLHPGSSYQAIFYREGGQGGGVMDAEFLHQIRSMLFDRLDAYVKISRNFAIATPFRDQLQNLLFASRQRVRQ